MRKGPVVIAILMFLLPAFSLGAGTGGLPGGQEEAIVALAAPSFETQINLTVPVRYYVLNASLNITGLSSESDQSAYPEDVGVLLNESVIWAFNGTGYGPLGMQNRFSDGARVGNVGFGASGVTGEVNLRLPEGAAVQSAVMDVRATPPVQWRELLDFTGVGDSFSRAGDVNGDGYDDLILGEPENDTGGTDTGRAYIHYGGTRMDNIADVVLAGEGAGDRFGFSVSGAGDVNGDGHDDLIVGAPNKEWQDGGTNAGQAYIFFGGRSMDDLPDVKLTGGEIWDQFGYSVAAAGDVNGDGYDDVLVGAWNNGNIYTYSGRAYIFLGGRSMDNVPDVIFTGAPTGMLGYSVSGAGDVDADGYDDVIVGAPGTDSSFEDAGAAYVYLGGQPMDNVSDATMHGNWVWDQFGSDVTGAGDVNGDGYDDVAVGAVDFHSLYAGRLEVFFGGRVPDGSPDLVVRGAEGDWLGASVSGAGDVNLDGYDDLLVSASGSDTPGFNFGRAYIYFGSRGMDGEHDVAFNGALEGGWFGQPVSGAGDVDGDGYTDILVGGGSRLVLFHQTDEAAPGILDADLTIGTATIWNRTGYFKGAETTGDFAPALNDYLLSASASGGDAYGNHFVDIPLGAGARTGGNLSLSNLKVVYRYTARVPDFADALNDYISTHKSEADAGGNLSVPIRIRSESPGRIELVGFEVRLDLPPVLVRSAVDVEMDEDTINSTLVDLYSIFDDEFDPDYDLNFSVLSASNSSIVFLGISDGRYLSVDAITGEANDNWTGNAEVIVACADSRGQRTESNPFTIKVKNVNDPPVITSSPVLAAEPGMPYYYDVKAVDGDRDALHYSLAKTPSNMTVDPAIGKLQWLPRARGTHEVIVVASDGVASGEQRFTLSVPNRPPRITSAPPVNATVGVPYTYKLTAEDPNLDDLNFSLLEGPEGMKVQPGTGRISWTPERAGEYRVAVEVWDGGEATISTFSVKARADIRGSETPIFAVAAVLSILLVGLAVGASTEVGNYRLTVLFLPLYSRMHKEEVLDNETRGMIRGFVAADPGTHYNEIIRRLNLANGEAAYHLSTLEREGYIKSLSDGRLKRFYPAGMKLLDIPSRLEPVQRIIYDAIRKSEGLGQREIARILKLPRSTVNRHINRLARLGILRLEKQRFTIKCYVANGAAPKEPESQGPDAAEMP